VRPITLILAADGREATTTVIAEPDAPTPFELSLPEPGAPVATLEVRANGPDCQGPDFEWKRYAQVLNLSSN
jgi:hypothetical protein